jgi:MSHA biogenesis protein MshG
MLVSRNLIPVDIKVTNGNSSVKDESNSSPKVHLWTRRVSAEDLVIFARQMYSLTKAGIPILRAINGLADTTNSVRMKVALNDISLELERGRTLSSALNSHSHIFNQLFVSLVHVGENTGKLDEAFLQLAEYLERDQETRKQIKSATRYPSFVLFAIVAALVVMNYFVIPQFASMFERLGAELPPTTVFLIGMSNFFIDYWIHIIITIIGGGVALFNYINTQAGRYRWDKMQLHIPIVGSIVERSILARFSRSFSMMLRSGVPLTSALNLVSDAVSNAFVADRVLGMKSNIEKGESLTRVALSSGLFTPLVLQMIGVGEETGRVDELLADTAEYYEREVDYDLRSLTSKIEPILIGIISVMVGVLALGIFTPMWNLMGAFSGG